MLGSVRGAPLLLGPLPRRVRTGVPGHPPRARHMGLDNVKVMIPFCRPVEEADRVLEVHRRQRSAPRRKRT